MNPEYEPHIETLSSLGASEFYMGYLNSLNESLSMLSLRLSPHANFSSIEHCAKAISKIKDCGGSSFITINGPFYPEEYYPALLHDIGALLDSGASGFVVSDISLMRKAKAAFPNLYLVISSGAHVTNSNAVDFYKHIGANRIILPRQLTIREISAILNNNPDTDFEIFMKNEECAFMDGYCSYSHYGDMDEKPACNMLFSCDTEMRAGKTEMWSCGTCALFHLKNFDNISLKICGRSLRYDPVYKDVEYLNNVLSILDKTLDFEQYHNSCRSLHKEIYGRDCDKKCYYEIDFSKPIIKS